MIVIFAPSVSLWRHKGLSVSIQHTYGSGSSRNTEDIELNILRCDLLYVTSRRADHPATAMPPGTAKLPPAVIMDVYLRCATSRWAAGDRPGTQYGRMIQRPHTHHDENTFQIIKKRSPLKIFTSICHSRLSTPSLGERRPERRSFSPARQWSPLQAQAARRWTRPRPWARPWSGTSPRPRKLIHSHTAQPFLHGIDAFILKLRCECDPDDTTKCGLHFKICGACWLKSQSLPPM